VEGISNKDETASKKSDCTTIKNSKTIGMSLYNLKFFARLTDYLDNENDDAHANYDLKALRTAESADRLREAFVSHT
jgi:hypothetical protein